MSISPLQEIEGLQVGTVDFVSPDQIKVLLDVDSPESVALNAGIPRGFPRVHSYLMIMVEEGYLVGQIEWLTVERSAFPKRRGYKDFGVIDLPFPLRRISVNPLGTLMRDAPDSCRFRRGTDSLPSIGSRVLLPTDGQLRAVVQSGARQRVPIGRSRLAANAEVAVDPDRIFGRHLAVLGNTGSGKSCSVAGLLRWSPERAKSAVGEIPNVRFVILDPNGEYARAFADDPGGVQAQVFRLGGGDDASPLIVPSWFWTSSEWSSFTQATARTQRPLLKRALRDIRAGRSAGSGDEGSAALALRRYLSSSLVSVRRDLRSGAIRNDATKFGFALNAVHTDLVEKVTGFPDAKLDQVVGAIQAALSASKATFLDKVKKEEVVYYRAFEEAPVVAVVEALKASLDTLGGILEADGPDEDIPIPFHASELADHIQVLAEQENVSQYVDFFVSRIRTLLSDLRIRQVIDDGAQTDLAEWLGDYIGRDAPSSKGVSIIDLSLVPSVAVYVLTAGLARFVFEALQRYRKLNGAALPTVLIMEEAHTFVKQYRSGGETQDPAQVCCQVFERIAREGRKFGLGLVLSSQRPSEVSPTVLSQCNTFLLHRISNDRDQEIVNKLVPDNLRGLLRELPSLPSQNAILLGWASELPVLVRMHDLPRHHQPHSDDPDFWDVWTGADPDGRPVERHSNWEVVAEDWQGGLGGGKEEADAGPASTSEGEG